MDNLGKDGYEANDYQIQMKTKDGLLIGSTIEADDVGIGGFDPATA